jgi:hypothetical protein
VLYGLPFYIINDIFTNISGVISNSFQMGKIMNQNKGASMKGLVIVLFRDLNLLD